MSVLEHLPRIKELPETLANQIAAGEVIERPASVLKELIENSIDASARKINIDIEEAGIGLIRVQDDGQGIHKDDLILALSPHATSKLDSFNDLFQIVSLGFRGEALPSIASVSRFKLTSRAMDSEQGWSIDNEFNIKPAAQQTGTCVEVSDLFHATPARRKFLKSERTEYLHIQALIRAISLSHFSIGLNVNHNGQSLYRLPACDKEPEQRILGVCGRTFLNKSFFVDVEKDGMHLWGWLGSSEVARSQSDRQYFYVNGRIVRDKNVNHAIRLAYQDHIAVGRFPAFVLHLQLEPEQLDVNVHPAKSEVRFSKTRDVHDFIYSSLLEGLSTTWLPVTEHRENDESEQVTGSQQKVSYQYEQTQQVSLLQDKKQTLNYLSLNDGTYIIAIVDSEQYLIDVAATRIQLAEEYLLEHYVDENIITRPVLVPLSLELDQKKIDFVMAHIQKIKQWGFELEQISPLQIQIRAIPARLAFADVIALLKDLIEALYLDNSDKDVAHRLAIHVNDAGLQPDSESIKQLINEISLNEADNKQSLPWRKLDQKTLSRLLK